MNRSTQLLELPVMLGGVTLFLMAISILFFPFTSKEISASSGKTIFQNRCASCHAVQANKTKLGPNLSNIGKDAAQRRTGYSATDYLLESVMSPEAFSASAGMMPSGLIDDLDPFELMGLIAYLQSLNGTIDYESLINSKIRLNDTEQKTTEEITLSVADIEMGRNLFFGRLQCNRCHHIEPLPNSNLLAPALSGVGHQSHESLVRSIREASAEINDQYAQRTFLTDEDRVLTGRVISETEVAVTLIQQDSSSGFELAKLEKERLLSSKKRTTSLMPSWTSESLSDTELKSLIAFLTTLR